MSENDERKPILGIINEKHRSKNSLRTKFGYRGDKFGILGKLIDIAMRTIAGSRVNIGKNNVKTPTASVCCLRYCAVMFGWVI